MKRRRLTFAALSAVTLLLTGCNYQGVTSLPLPGTVRGSDTYQVTVVVNDATNLVNQETCRANNVAVGSVTSIKVGADLKAHVTCSIKDDVTLPANSVGRIAETSLLGERFVELGTPTGQHPTGHLSHEATIPADENHVDPSTEQVLSTLSMVLNGGSLNRIQTISTEVNHALSGHTSDIRSVLHELRTLTSRLNQHRRDITHALEAVDHLSSTLSAQRDVLASTLDTLPKGLRVLNNQKDRVVGLLAHLSTLSKSAVPVIDASKTNTLADLRLLQPILKNLAKNGGQIASALDIASYPFPKNAPGAVKGDYAGLYAHVKVNLDTVNTLLQQELHAPTSNRADTPSDLPPGGRDGAQQRPDKPTSQLPLPSPGNDGNTPLTAPSDTLRSLLGGGQP